MFSLGEGAILHPARTLSARNYRRLWKRHCGANILCFEIRAELVLMQPGPALGMGNVDDEAYCSDRIGSFYIAR